MSRASVAKECYEAHCQPWAEDQVEEESLKKVILIFIILTSFNIIFVILSIINILITIAMLLKKASDELTSEERIEQLMISMNMISLQTFIVATG